MASPCVYPVVVGTLARQPWLTSSSKRRLLYTGNGKVKTFFFFSLFNIYRKRRRKQKKTITENEQTSLSVCSSKVEVIFRDALAPLKCAAWQQVKLLLLSIIIVEKKKKWYHLSSFFLSRMRQTDRWLRKSIRNITGKCWMKRQRQMSIEPI